MTYRDDITSARAQRDALAAELAEIRLRLKENATLDARARELAAEIAEASDRVRHARLRSKLPLLGEVSVATPCYQSWDEMKGDDRVRFCAGCEKHVYDLSEMTATEAEALLARSGEKPCVRLHRRPDGTVLTSDCPEGVRNRRRRRRIALAGAALLAGGIAAGVSATVCTTQTMGDVGVEVKGQIRPEKPPSEPTMGAPPEPPPEHRTMGVPRAR